MVSAGKEEEQLMQELEALRQQIGFAAASGRGSKWTEAIVRLDCHFLTITNRHAEMSPLLAELAAAVRTFTGCAAAGIRMLDDEGNIPYQACQGFSPEFYESESPLSVRSDECMCINVIRGLADPTLPHYTEAGSFYTNSTTRFLATLSEEEKRRTRGACNRFGYESVALVPIRVGKRILGLIQAADPRQNMVPLPMVEVLEDVAMKLGVAITRVWAEKKAVTDALTGLFNHRHFHERLEQEVARASRHAQTFSLVMVDIDHFKKYNDTHGHLAGDSVLRAVGRAVQSNTRQYDTAFRYGGDEFALLLPQADEGEAKAIVGRIRRKLRRMASRGLGISAGVACYLADAMERRELIAMADAALYHAKGRGGDVTCSVSDLGDSLELLERGRGVVGLSSVYALAAAADAKDHYTFGHSQRVADLCVRLGRALALSRTRLSRLRSAALLHDIGKVGIPGHLLGKRGPLSWAQWRQMRRHPELGVRVARRVPRLASVLPAILHHHERFDGQGYPSGLRGEAIPLEARVIHIADAYDTMTTARSYCKTVSVEKAVAELRHCAGTQFDPELVQAFAVLLGAGAPPKSQAT